MTPAALQRLGKLMEARKARDLAHLEQLVAEERRLRGELDTLAATPRVEAESGETLPPDRQAVRLAWIDRQATLLRERLALLAPQIARARAAAVQSLGREQALERLARNAATVERSIRSAREEREMPLGPT